MADNLLSAPDQKPPQPIVQSINPKTIPAGIIGQRQLRAGYTMVKYGLATDRPKTTTEIVLYFATDTYVLSYWNGTEWIEEITFTPDKCFITKDDTNEQVITTATLTAISFPYEPIDTNNLHDPVTNNSRVTIKQAGYYSIFGKVTWNANATGVREIRIYVNGVSVAYEAFPANSISSYLTTTISYLANLKVGDYVQIYVNQTSGGDLNTTQWSDSNNLLVQQVN